MKVLKNLSHHNITVSRVNIDYKSDSLFKFYQVVARSIFYRERRGTLGLFVRKTHWISCWSFFPTHCMPPSGSQHSDLHAVVRNSSATRFSRPGSVQSATRFSCTGSVQKEHGQMVGSKAMSMLLRLQLEIYLVQMKNRHFKCEYWTADKLLHPSCNLYNLCWQL